MQNKLKRLVAWVSTATLTAVSCMSVAWASGLEAGSGTDNVLTEAETFMNSLQEKVLGISSALCFVAVVIALCMWAFGNAKQSKAGWKWVKRIVITYIAINLVMTIIAVVGNHAGI